MREPAPGRDDAPEGRLDAAPAVAADPRTPGPSASAAANAAASGETEPGSGGGGRVVWGKAGKVCAGQLGRERKPSGRQVHCVLLAAGSASGRTPASGRPGRRRGSPSLQTQSRPGVEGGRGRGGEGITSVRGAGTTRRRPGELQNLSGRQLLRGRNALKRKFSESLCRRLGRGWREGLRKRPSRVTAPSVLTSHSLVKGEEKLAFRSETWVNHECR